MFPAGTRLLSVVGRARYHLLTRSFCFAPRHTLASGQQLYQESSRHQSTTTSLRTFPSYKHLVQRFKQSAQCSFVIEDRTSDAFVWHQESDEIKRNLLAKINEKNVQIYRWRIGPPGRGRKRFLLVEFNNVTNLQASLIDLQAQFGISFHERICFVRDFNVLKWRTEFFNTKTGAQLRYAIQAPTAGEHRSANELEIVGMLSDFNKQFSIPFEDFSRISSDAIGAAKSSPRPGVGRKNSSIMSRSEIKTWLKSFESATKNGELLSELQFKLRFFIIHQVEQIMKKCCAIQKYSNGQKNSVAPLLGQLELVPFGSDVSGLGNADSDLDLCFIFKDSLGDVQKKVKDHQTIRILHSVSTMLERAIKLQSTPTTANRERVNYIFNHFHRIDRIFRAFVPIIKCRSRFLPDLNIDISVDSEKNSGVQMSQYLFHCTSRSDPRVKPFILLLKAWAKHHKVVKSDPGNWFSSFQITILGIVFLQHSQLIPTINEWKQLTKPSILLAQRSDCSVEEIFDLLQRFFQFMLSYDFWSKAFDLNTGECDLKKPNPEYNLCYVVNPFLTNLNICKTVSEQELERFLSYCQQANEIMNKRDYQFEQLFLEPTERLPNLSSL